VVPSRPKTRQPANSRRAVRQPRDKEADALKTVPITPERWMDFERLFARNRGMHSACWCMFYHRAKPVHLADEADRPDRNRLEHRELVRAGRGHGVLVYRDGEPVGWCQFGLREELPRIDAGRKYRSIAPTLGPTPRWRITCFYVDRPERRHGVAQVALRGALGEIARGGGGVVEGYPATNPRAVGIWFGTRAMFEREGFRVVGPFGKSNVLVRRSVPSTRGGRE
jgi:GNAT superfamily N-acetyltransferase